MGQVHNILHCTASRAQHAHTRHRRGNLDCIQICCQDCGMTLDRLTMSLICSRCTGSCAFCCTHHKSYDVAQLLPHTSYSVHLPYSTPVRQLLTQVSHQFIPCFVGGIAYFCLEPHLSNCLDEPLLLFAYRSTLPLHLDEQSVVSASRTRKKDVAHTL